jgi:hypothetical protein|tara:strand:- start:54 stop:545 length:492 start_codon:yes stop_codon:yes gene_type:complete
MMMESKKVDQNTLGSFHIQPNPRISVTFNHENIQYSGGDQLRARYIVEGIESQSISAVERSVVWYTEGKGEEDLGVVFFERIQLGRRKEDTQISSASLSTDHMTGALATELPHSPLSYEGIIVKIRWCVRIRVFFQSGRDFVSEHIFFLGSVPVVRLPSKIEQ